MKKVDRDGELMKKIDRCPKATGFDFVITAYLPCVDRTDASTGESERITKEHKHSPEDCDKLERYVRRYNEGLARGETESEARKKVHLESVVKNYRWNDTNSKN